MLFSCKHFCKYKPEEKVQVNLKEVKVFDIQVADMLITAILKLSAKNDFSTEHIL